MAKFQCMCGEVISTSGDIPNQLEYKVISDLDFDSFHGLVDAEDLYQAFTSMFRCPECERLWVYWNGFAEPPTAYVKYPAEPAGGNP